MSRIKQIISNYYPWLLILLAGLSLYAPYLFGHYIIQSSAGLNKYNNWEFLLSSHFGWINFFKGMGEFVGGDSNYGWFNPIYLFFRAINLSDQFLAEHILGIVYFCGAFIASYFLFRKNAYAKWIAIFAASVYTLNGLALKVDQNTSLGFTNYLFFPLLFWLAQKELKTYWQKILFIFLIGLQATYSNPQLIVWQLIFIFLYILFCKKNKLKILFRFAIASILGVLLALPQYLLTSSMFAFDTQSLGSYEVGGGIEIYNLLHIFFPFFTTGITNYISPYYFTNILGSLILFISLPLLIKNWRQLPINIKFFLAATILSFIATLENNPLQYLLARIPFINIFLARTPIRYLHIYFFSVSFLVAYILKYYLSQKEQILKFSKKIFIIGLIISLGYLTATLIFAFGHEQIFARAKDWLINHRLANTRGNYPEIYYVNLLKYYFYSFVKKFTLLSWTGIFNALPFIVAIFWWLTARKNDRIIRFWPGFLMLNIIIASGLYSLILSQSARVKSDLAWQNNPDHNINTYLQETESAPNYYFIGYGNYFGETFYRQNYLDSYDIINWLGTNHYSTGRTNYQSASEIQNFTDPFQVFRHRLITTYIGFMPADLNNANHFDGQYASNPEILNPQALNKNQIDETRIANNLIDRLNFLRQIGVRYVVSHVWIEDQNLELIKKIYFDKPSQLIPDFTAYLYVYQITSPGQIIFVPEKVQTLPEEKIDTLNFYQAKEIFDKINYDNITTIEYPDENILEQKNKKQKIDVQKMDNDQIIFKTDFTESTFVVININHYPGWQAWIDNQPTPLLRANLSFMAVKIPAGQHQITLKFNPWLMVENVYK